MTLERRAPAQLLSIGDLSARTGVPTSSLRYYDELGLVRPETRASGRRRYTDAAIRRVGLVVYFRAVGFTLHEIARFLSGARESRRDLVDGKLTELVEQQHRLQVAIEALQHGQGCPAEDHLACPKFWAIIEAHQDGHSVEESHTRADDGA